MYARATGLFTIYRGTTTNDSGDTVDDNTTSVNETVPWLDSEPWDSVQPWDAPPVAIALHNVSIVEDNPNTNSPRIITAIRGRAARGTDLRVRDRIKDTSTLLLYVVDTVSAPLSSTRNSDLSFSCHRVN